MHVDEPTPEQAATWSRLQLLSEGSADLITHLPGIKNEAQARMGLPTAPEQPFPSGYDMFVDALTAMLHQAGLEPTAPEHRQEIIELLERSPMEDVPAAMATYIVQRQGIDWKHHYEIERAIERIGEHGVIPEDADSFAVARQELDARTRDAEDLIGQLARDSRVRRERNQRNSEE